MSGALGANTLLEGSPAAAAARAGARALRWGLPALVAAATLAAFSPALRGGFLNWDDAQNFLANPHYRGLGWAELRWMWTAVHMGHWIPLTWLTLGLDHALWGMNPLGYHLSNLLLHAGAALAFYTVALRLLALALPAAAPAERALGATAAALLFAVHPLRVESVAWITERRDVLSGLLYLLAVLAYLVAVQGRPRPRAGWYWAAVGLFAGALMSKSMAATLPVVLLILDVYPLGRLGGARGWRQRQVWLEKLPFLALGAAAGLIAFRALAAVPNQPSLEALGPGSRALLVAHGLTFYLVKTLLPLGLSPLYPLPGAVPWPWVAAPVAGAAAVLALARRWPALGAAAVAYVVTLLPVSGVFQNGPQGVADRYSYLACLGWALLAGGLVARRWAGARALRAAVAGGIALLGVLTWQQAAVWQSSVTLWRHAAALDPANAAARVNLAGAYLEAGRLDAALGEYRAALRLSGDTARWHAVIGWVLAQQGALGPALDEFRAALRLEPGRPDACANARRAADLLRVPPPPELAGCPEPGG